MSPTRCRVALTRVHARARVRACERDRGLDYSSACANSQTVGFSVLISSDSLFYLSPLPTSRRSRPPLPHHTPRATLATATSQRPTHLSAWATLCSSSAAPCCGATSSPQWLRFMPPPARASGRSSKRYGVEEDRTEDGGGRKRYGLEEGRTVDKSEE